MRACLYFLALMLIGCNSDSERRLAMGGVGEEKSVENPKALKFNPLTAEEEKVILHKGTELPFSGKYNDHFTEGVYTCKHCSAILYQSGDKFKSHCGWPAFDDNFPGAVKRVPDSDGERTEIVCANCGGHLGHIFFGESFTQKSTRHCVNSISMNFVPLEQVKFGRAIFAGGCFWGVEYYLQRQPGVLSTTVGYIGGRTTEPGYQEVCSKTTGHAEAVEVVFDPVRTSFEILTRFFFEIHDPTQIGRQGPDIGDQYRSEVFYLDEEQKQTVEKLIKILQEKGYKVGTRVSKADKFWPAEEYHQDYYQHKNTTPYCHTYTKRF